MTHHPRERPQVLSFSTQRTFAIAVIGGGIVGAGVYRDATLRGAETLLLEKEDFGYGASSRSSKLAHGGLRYLEQGRFRLVFEACHERDLLRRLAPHLIRPLPFLYPIYGQRRKLTKIKLGMLAYDLLSSFHNIKPHRILGRDETRRIAGGLRTEGLVGGAYYYDAFVDDARLVVNTLRSANSENGVLLNHVEVTGVEKHKRIFHLETVDRLTGATYPFRARALVITAGPWSDAFRGFVASPDPLVRLTKGVHLMLPRHRLPLASAVVLHAASDGRVMFTIPWGGFTVIGTTDTDYEGSPDEVTTDARDLHYLLDSIDRHFPEARLTPADVTSTYAGLRPLIYQDGAAPSQVSREERYYETPEGSFTVIGGKLTTYRKMAQEITDRALRYLARSHGLNFPASVSARLPLSGGAAQRGHPFTRDWLRHPRRRHLFSRYGSEAWLLEERIEQSPALAERLTEDTEHTVGEALYCIEEEQCLTLSDLLIRRLRLNLLSQRRGLDAAGRAAELMAGALRETSEWTRRQVSRYKEEIAAYHPSGEEIAGAARD